MPTCRRCGRDLTQTELSISNWTEVSKKTFYSCIKCGGNWLYSKDLNCPILIDTKNIEGRTAVGKKSQFRHSRSLRQAKTTDKAKAKAMT